MSNNEIKELRYEWHCNSWDIGGKDEDTRREGTIDAVIGETEFIEGFGKLNISSISEESITIESFNSIEYLTPGSFVSFRSEVDGYEDHDGVLWNGDTYYMNIYWD